MPFDIVEVPRRMTEFALHDRGLASARIFRPLGRGAGSKANSKERVEDLVKVNDPFLGEIQLTVGAFYPVGVKEEDLLLVLLGIAGLTDEAPNRRARLVAPGEPDHGVLVKKMRVEKDCLPHDIYEVKASPWLILKELSADPEYKPSADAYAELQPRLKRLSWISYSATGVKGNGRWAQGASAMLSYSMDEDGVVVSFNERLARVILGVPDPENPGGRPKRWFAKISLTERFALKSDVARILHRLLSVWIDDPLSKPKRGRKCPAPETLTVGVERLVEHVYGAERVTERPQRYRAKTVRDALGEIAALEKWAVQIDGKGRQAFVQRLPQTSGAQQTRMAL
jgi:hypothetical protein